MSVFENVVDTIPSTRKQNFQNAGLVLPGISYNSTNRFVSSSDHLLLYTFRRHFETRGPDVQKTLGSPAYTLRVTSERLGLGSLVSSVPGIVVYKNIDN